jgi:hypothetical protein
VGFEPIDLAPPPEISGKKFRKEIPNRKEEIPNQKKEIPTGRNTQMEKMTKCLREKNILLRFNINLRKNILKIKFKM